MMTFSWNIIFLWNIMGWWKERGEVEVLIWIRASKILAQGLFSAECLPLCRRLGCGESSLSGAEKHQSSAALHRVHVCFSFDKVHFIFLPKFIKWKWQGFFATAKDSFLLSVSPNSAVIFFSPFGRPDLFFISLIRQLSLIGFHEWLRTQIYDVS